MSDNNVIKNGATVIVQRFDHMKIHEFKSPKKINVKLGNITVDLSGIEGHHFETAFQMIKGGSKNFYTLTPADIPIDFDDNKYEHLKTVHLPIKFPSMDFTIIFGF